MFYIFDIVRRDILKTKNFYLHCLKFIYQKTFYSKYNKINKKNKLTWFEYANIPFTHYAKPYKK